MPDIQSALKAEIARVARKEVRGELAVLKKASFQYRSQIAGLRREVEDLQKNLKVLAKGEVVKTTRESSEEAATPLRFMAAGLAVSPGGALTHRICYQGS